MRNTLVRSNVSPRFIHRRLALEEPSFLHALALGRLCHAIVDILLVVIDLSRVIFLLVREFCGGVLELGQLLFALSSVDPLVPNVFGDRIEDALYTVRERIARTRVSGTM